MHDRWKGVRIMEQKGRILWENNFQILLAMFVSIVIQLRIGKYFENTRTK